MKLKDVLVVLGAYDSFVNSIEPICLLRGNQEVLQTLYETEIDLPEKALKMSVKGFDPTSFTFKELLALTKDISVAQEQLRSIVFTRKMAKDLDPVLASIRASLLDRLKGAKHEELEIIVNDILG